MEHLQILAVLARCAREVAEVAEGGASARDRCADQLDNRIAQGMSFASDDSVCATEWVNPGGPERLVDVDVPQTGDDRLVQKQRFDQRLAAAQLLRQIPGAKRGGQRFRAEAAIQDLGLLVGQQAHLAESTGV